MDTQASRQTFNSCIDRLRDGQMDSPTDEPIDKMHLDRFLVALLQKSL
jgi:hypothetical protein